MAHQIKVTNDNSFEIVDYFDGIAYRLEPGKSINIPEEAAFHIFGCEFPGDADFCASDEFREKIFRFLQKRWGWNSIDEAKVAKSKEIFSKISFVPVVMKTVEIVSRDPAALAEPRQEKRPGRPPKFKPRVDDGEADEEVVA